MSIKVLEETGVATGSWFHLAGGVHSAELRSEAGVTTFTAKLLSSTVPVVDRDIAKAGLVETFDETLGADQRLVNFTVPRGGASFVFDVTIHTGSGKVEGWVS